MKEQVLSYIETIKSVSFEKMDDLETFRIQYLGKKGIIPALFADFKNVAAADRKEMGVLLNDLKQAVTTKIDEAKDLIENLIQHIDSSNDLSLPVSKEIGTRHPLSLVRNEIIEIFARIGFTVEEGPEIEDD